MGISSIVLAFYYSWKLALLVLVFVPFILLAGIAQFKIFSSFARKNAKSLAEAGAGASQAIMQIRTVAGLGQERYFYDKYVEALAVPYK